MEGDIEQTTSPEDQGFIRADHATRFQPGQSGNPGGRPTGIVSVTAKLRKLLSQNGADEKLARAMILNAAKGNGPALAAILDRIDGPARVGEYVPTFLVDAVIEAWEAQL